MGTCAPGSGVSGASAWGRRGMANQITGIILAAALTASMAEAADPLPSLAGLRVASTNLVSPAEYREASAFAARASTPLDIALKIVGEFAGSVQHIIQVNEGAEAPSGSRVTVIRDGLLDDSIRGERWDIVLQRAASGAWGIKEVRRSWRCWRGAHGDRFAAVPCP